MKRSYALLVLPVAALALTACGGGGSHAGAAMPLSPVARTTQAPMGSRHNAADVTFTQLMIPHHRQTIALAALAATRASSPKVKSLVAGITAAGQPEIDKMTGWLASWGAPAIMDGMPHGDGAVSAADMQRLGTLKGAAFDAAFLPIMIAHDQGAVSMARTEQAQGLNPDVTSLAAGIVTARNTEITTLHGLLNGA